MTAGGARPAGRGARGDGECLIQLGDGHVGQPDTRDLAFLPQLPEGAEAFGQRHLRVDVVQLVYNCCFSSELLRREQSWTREDPLLGFLLWAGPTSSPGRGVLTISLPPSALGECLVHLDALAALRHRPLALHRPDIVGRLSLLFGQLGQAGAQARGELPGKPGTVHPAVVQAMRLLEADLTRDWTLKILAAELHLAAGYLVRLFNAATGLPPMAYLGQLRAEHAAVLLLHADEPVTSIGRAVGWPDQSGFARRFKAHYGLSATAYRKRFATRAA